MTPIYKPGDAEIAELARLLSIAKSAETGEKLTITVQPFEIAHYPTKSHITGLTIVNVEPKTSKPLEQAVVAKEYIPGSIERTSERERRDSHDEFRIEKAILALDLRDPIKRTPIFPRWLSREATECTQRGLLFREYVSEPTLEQIAESQKQSGGIKWEGVIGQNLVSDVLRPISVLHNKTPYITEYMKEIGLLKEEPGKINPEKLADSRAASFIRYLERLILATGKQPYLFSQAVSEAAFKAIDKDFVSTKDLQSIVHGELDCFPQHATPNNLIDSGSVEIGGRIRDLAVFAAPVFGTLSRKDLVEAGNLVIDTYNNIITGLPNGGGLYNPSKIGKNALLAGWLFAGFNGNVRKAAAIVNYNLRDVSYPLDEAETSIRIHLARANELLNTFRSQAEGIYKESANKLLDIFEKSGLTKKYSISKNCRDLLYNSVQQVA